MQREFSLSMLHGCFYMLSVEMRGEYRSVGCADLRGDVYVAGDLRRDTEIGEISLRAFFKPDCLPDALNLAVTLLAVGLRFAAVILGTDFDKVVAGLPGIGHIQFKIGIAALMTADMRVIDENVCAIIDSAKAEKDSFRGFKVYDLAIPADAGNVFFNFGERAGPSEGNDDAAVVSRAGLRKKSFVSFLSFGEKHEIPFAVQILPAAPLTFGTGKLFLRNVLHTDASVQ